MKVLLVPLTLCLFTTAVAGSDQHARIATAVTTGQQAGDRYRDLTLIVLNSGSLADAHKALAELAKSARFSAVIYPPNVVVAILPGRELDVVGRHHRVKHVRRDRADAHAVGVTDSNARSGVEYFNAAVSGRILETVDITGPSGAILETVTTRPGPAASADTTDVSRFRMGTQNHTGFVNESLTGGTIVNVFWVESSGATDPDLYTWPQSLDSVMQTRISDAVLWWHYVAQQQGVLLQTSLIWHTQYGVDGSKLLQPYEPVTHPSYDAELWINPIMANFGYTQTTPSGGVYNALARVSAYNQTMRQATGAQNAYAIFMVYNPHDPNNQSGAPWTFANGVAAAAFPGGPWIDILYYPANHTAAQFSRVAAHEIGHIFYACDEYSLACTDCSACFSAPRANLGNANCDANVCNPNPSSCIMLDPSQYANYAVCNATKQQIGW